MTKFYFKNFNDSEEAEKSGAIAEFVQLANQKKQKSFEKIAFCNQQIDAQINTEEVTDPLKQEFDKGYEKGRSDATAELLEKHKLEIEIARKEEEAHFLLLMKNISADFSEFNKNALQKLTNTSDEFCKLVTSIAMMIIKSTPTEIICNELAQLLKEAVNSNYKEPEILVHTDVAEILRNVIHLDLPLKITGSNEITEKCDFKISWEDTSVEKITKKYLDKIETIIKEAQFKS